jgi:hypothetical protein
MTVEKQHLSIELDGALLDVLDEHGREDGESREEATARLVEEGLRMAKHPWVFFRDGPAGRRAVLMGGPDVWQVADVFLDQPMGDDESIGRTVERTVGLMGQPHHLVRAAVLYYLDYREEIEHWINRNADEAEQAEAEWLRRREPLRT